MRTATKEIKIYNLEDVKNNPKLKEKVLNKYADINTNYDWWDGEYDIIRNELGEYGFNDVEIEFTGFYSQGDGGSFTCKTIDFVKWMEKKSYNRNYYRLITLIEKRLITIEGEIKRDRNTHYVHWNTTSLYTNMFIDSNKNHPNIESILEELESDIIEFMIAKNKEIYKNLENVYNDITSEDAIMDTLEYNDYEFTEDGKIYRE